jgi:hypothetical protein
LTRNFHNREFDVLVENSDGKMQAEEDKFVPKRELR